ncbi:MoxR-like ATPase [Arcanobacterium wilhelmae]|uniref:MoxR-like ATPase n=1 Tax=Arcanobacterium wilhelmae TaxID=1803177 RepID=A0ABT9NAU8_9ACTO|nr:MoxR family ATPase [Arcanobacterium wilhelmae]MDP9800816.1 MoxR-like ATPase [Arcanobacterium wilhelmae]WFN90192.1 MoxR family ATPase [Arcanobacterium wilhelmae]
MNEQMNAETFAQTFEEIAANVGRAVLGKKDVIRLALTAMMARGHLLIEDAPGTGKTALARAIAASIDSTASRIQFTPDLLPSDITGVTMYDQLAGKWEFHPGPIFAQVVLADEINRASPKTQSALLEVMEEGHVTVDGTAYPASRPFMVIATQNPIEQAGTYPLPEAQLDRFLMKIEVGFPPASVGVAVLSGANIADRASELSPVVDADTVNTMIDAAANVHASDELLAFVWALAQATREDPEARLGVSIRGALAMVRAAKVWAGVEGRDYVIPDDVLALVSHVWEHRIVLDPDAQFSGATAAGVLERAIAKVPAP